MGSTPFFWNWLPEYQEEVRDGQPHFRVSSGEKPYKVPQQSPKSGRDGELVADKIVPVRKKGYIDAGYVLSLIHYFYVPKGEDDVRIVYNGTGSGLNDTLWAPHFGLPDVRHTTRSLMPGYFQCDLDIGEMFLNFLLHEEMMKMFGVDVRYVRSAATSDQDWESRRRCNWESWC